MNEFKRIFDALPEYNAVKFCASKEGIRKQILDRRAEIFALDRKDPMEVVKFKLEEVIDARL